MLTCLVVSLVWDCRGRGQKCGEMADGLLTLGADMLIDDRLWMVSSGGTSGIRSNWDIYTLEHGPVSS